jgi:NADPH-dependent 7-cyano-7-deazaguanine reductase QueF
VVVTLEALDLGARVRVRLAARFSAVCPLSGSIDEYVAVIEYEGRGRYLELGSLRRYLDSFRLQEWYHEELCEKIAEDLAGILGVPVRVTLRSAYLGVAVEVEKLASPPPSERDPDRGGS